MKRILAAIVLVAAALPATGRTESFLYISHSPDVRYSGNGRDARIELLPEESGYSYGHDLGRLTPCAPGITGCLAFDFMAVATIPAHAAPGDSFTRGDFTFKVEELTHFGLLGQERETWRVAVRKNGQLANRFYFSPAYGVLAIGVLNFSNPDIPESLFIVTSDRGIFHASP